MGYGNPKPNRPLRKPWTEIGFMAYTGMLGLYKAWTSVIPAAQSHLPEVHRQPAHQDLQVEKLGQGFEEELQQESRHARVNWMHTNATIMHAFTHHLGFLCPPWGIWRASMTTSPSSKPSTTGSTWRWPRARLVVLVRRRGLSFLSSGPSQQHDTSISPIYLHEHKTLTHPRWWPNAEKLMKEATYVSES